MKRPTSNAYHTIGNGDGGEATAILKRLSLYVFYLVGDSDGNQASTIAECATFYGCQLRRKCDWSQTITARKTTGFDIFHAIGNGDGCKVTTTTERIGFNSYYVTVQDGGSSIPIFVGTSKITNNSYITRILCIPVFKSRANHPCFLWCPIIEHVIEVVNFCK